MTSRIIKQGTERAYEIQQFTFADRGSMSIPPVEQPPWQESFDVSGSLPNIMTDPVPGAEVNASTVMDADFIAREAYEKGFREGEASGIQAAERKIESAMKRYADSLLEISSLKPSLYSQAEHEVVKLAIEIARKIVHREIRVDRDIIHTFIRVALSHVTEKTSVIINLNPADYKYIMECREKPGQAVHSDIVFQSDNSIEQGGCLVETKCGNVDARIEEKFREVEHAFFEDMK